MSVASRNYSNSNRSGRTSTARGTPAPNYIAAPAPKDLKYFVPTASTSLLFLYAHGHSIVCCRHDQLNIERTFLRHSDEVQLLAVDNVSDHGAGRLAVSYDAGQTAIVWDVMTGEELSRFASYEHLTTAAWMRNGNVVFGNTQGNIILFEPATSEHISSRTLDQIAITALAPSSDCRTFAIGYANGTLLVATLQPRFTILHNLTTSKGPSPIVTLAWHASSERSKADMLAVQTHDGDLRVWSVAKAYNADDPAKVVRILRRNENFLTGPNWMGWSKNGRIIQFSESDTLSWDVRTKHVTHDSIPTLPHVRGIAVYGPGASLFTLGPNNTVQQFDLNSPAIMVANVQHPAGILPPSPPTSDEIGNRSVHSSTTIHTSGSESSNAPLGMISESDDDNHGPYSQYAARSGRERNYDMYESGSVISSRSGISSASRSSAGSHIPGGAARSMRSMRSRAMTEHTHISAGSSLKSSTVGGQNLDGYSMGYSLASTSVPSVASSRSRHRPSRLRNEIPHDPNEGKIVQDLFQFTRSRLSDVPYRPLMATNSSRLTNDDLRRQMLSTIFGWHGEMEDLIRDEMSRHPSGSTNRILLAKWLGDMESDIMAAGSQNMTSSDWMLLALSGIGGQASQQKLGRTYIQRLLENGEIHVAVTIMLGLGDHNDAIEIYVSHKRYMEALILACVIFPGVWERQAAIIRKWGEWAVQHGQQQLAIRCFACTGQESSEPWTSPSATQLTFQNMTPSMTEILSPPLSPPGPRVGPQRSIGSTLKVITSFGDQNQKAKLWSQVDDGPTPTAAGMGHFAESSLMADAGNDEARTAFINPSNNSRFNTPTTARPTGPSFGRDRLPSIGETPFDLNRDNLEALRRPVDRPLHSRTASLASDHEALGNGLQRATTASPMMMREGFQRINLFGNSDRPPSPDQAVMSKMQQVQTHQKATTRDRNTRGLHLQLDPLQDPSLEQLNSKYQWPSRHRGPASVASSVTSASSAGRSYRPDTRQRGREDNIRSLDAAQYVAERNRSRAASRRRGMSRDPSEERGRNNPKRSPTSPVSMSPRDLAVLGKHEYPEASASPLAVRKANRFKARGNSRASSRGRGKGRADSVSRSPSPIGSVSTSAMHYQGSEDEEDYQKAMQAREEFRSRHCKSANRGLNSAASSRHALPESGNASAAKGHLRVASSEHAGDLRQIKDERQRKKEQAARDLEERRRSLVKRQNIVPVPQPGELSSRKLSAPIEADEGSVFEGDSTRSTVELPKSKFARSRQHYVGLPATPKAMKLPLRPAEETDKVPEIPPAFTEQAAEAPPPPKEDEGPLLTLLPSTVYQPPTRGAIPRSMSAPIPEDGSKTRRPRRKSSMGEMKGLGNIKENQKDEEEQVIPPPPPPPAQPVLRELQHLAIPPPPPPAPLPNMPRHGQSGGALQSGMIEIVMDDDDDDDDDDEEGEDELDDDMELQPKPLAVAAPNDGMVPVLPPPMAPFRGHERHRSNAEVGLPGRNIRLADRVAASNRSRQNSIKTQQIEIPADFAALNQLRSPTSGGPPPVAMYDPGMIRPHFEYHQRNNSTGLSESEMI